MTRTFVSTASRVSAGREPDSSDDPGFGPGPAGSGRSCVRSARRWGRRVTAMDATRWGTTSGRAVRQRGNRGICRARGRSPARRRQHAQRGGVAAGGRAGPRAAAVRRHRPGAGGAAEKRGPAHLHPGRSRVLIVVLLFPQLTRRLPRSATAISVIRVYYPDGRGVLRDVLQHATARGFAIDELSTATTGNGRSAGNGRPYASEPDSHTGEHRMVEVTLQVHGRGLVNELAAGLSEIPGVRAVVAGDVHAAEE